MITIILLGIYNGLFISWGLGVNGKSVKWSKQFHRLGFFIRCFMFVEFYYFVDFYFGLGLLLLALSFFNMNAFFYKIAISITRRLCGDHVPLFHLGDKTNRKLNKLKIPIHLVWIALFGSVIFNILWILEPYLIIA